MEKQKYRVLEQIEVDVAGEAQVFERGATVELTENDAEERGAAVKLIRQYEVLRGSFTQYVDGKARVFNEGDTIELTEDEAAAHAEGSFALKGIADERAPFAPPARPVPVPEDDDDRP